MEVCVSLTYYFSYFGSQKMFNLIVVAYCIATASYNANYILLYTFFFFSVSIAM